jgi:ParB-like nuclease family protein
VPQSSELRTIVQRMLDAGESEENIGAVIRRLSSSQLETTEPERSLPERVMSGAWRGLTGMAGFMGKATGIPGFIREGPLGAVKDQAELLKNVFYDAPAAQFEKMRTAPSTTEAIGHAVAGAVPLVGPMAGYAGEEIGAGRGAELAGEMAVGAALPFMPKGSKAVLRRGSAAASSVERMVPSGATAALLRRAAKYAAKQVIPPIITEGADVALNALRKNVATGEAPAVTRAPRPMVGDPPPPTYAPEAPPMKAPAVAPEGFAMATDTVGGLKVRKEIPNTSSIRSSFNDYEELPGVREVQMSALNDKPPKFYSKSEETRTRKLAEEIKANGEISPLIVAIDEKGPYILEGGHRFDALKLLNVKSFPAVVVKDLDVKPVPKATAATAVTVSEPNPPSKAQAAVKATTPNKSAAEQLRDKMSAKELTRVREALGTQDVKIARYEPRQGADGKFIGVSDPVYVMPAEFVEQAQMMGLRARGHTALEKSYRSR